METKNEEFAFHLERVKQALRTLEQVLEMPSSDVVRDASIQRFEYTFELAWKLFKKAAKIDGIEVNSPRQALRAAYQMGLITDIDIWFEMLEDRNMTSYTYDQYIAQKVYESAKRLPRELKTAMAGIDRFLVP